MIFSDWNNLKSSCGGNATNPIYFDYNGQTFGNKCYAEAQSISAAYFDTTNTYVQYLQ